MTDTEATDSRTTFLTNLRERVLPLRARAVVRNDWLKQRLDTILPAVMAREGFDMWIIAAREYNEDPVIMTLLPEPSMAARRRTILVFSRRSDGSVERLTLDRYGFGEFYTKGWDPEAEEQDACLARVVRERDPQTIGLDISATFAFGDGLTHHEYTRIAALGEELMARTTSAERLCVGWLERRIPAELEVYPSIIGIGHAIIAEAFSSRTIQPGSTTTDDVVWWMRQTMLDAGLQAWFQPTITIQSPGEAWDAIQRTDDRRTLIQHGDLLHCDMGFYYLGLATDHQQHAYIRKPGETAAPAGLVAALAAGNRLQDILRRAMTVGHSGNTVLREALADARDAGLTPSIYTHPLGYHGHAAGPTIGLWDRQDGVPGNGDYPLYDNTCYSIELNVRHPVPEWGGQEVRIALEEDAVLTGGTVSWLAGRQTEFHVI
ncbi:MAG: M24 family metallopeptidase [Chloroflexota bacterium]|nr:M24 family metallopeptidase [Chloroflexota bacterium]